MRRRDRQSRSSSQQPKVRFQVGSRGQVPAHWWSCDHRRLLVGAPGSGRALHLIIPADVGLESLHAFAPCLPEERMIVGPLDAFHNVFCVRSGDALFVSPEVRLRVWGPKA